MEFRDNTTLGQAKAHLRLNWEKGVECPCCRQFVMLYKRKLNSGMAITLIRIYQQPRAWIHVKDFLRRNKYFNGHDWTLLKHWGLLEEKESKPDEPCSGMWRITDKGVAFVRNQIEVEKRLYFYNNKVYGRDTELTNIIEALGSKFNYHELMNGAGFQKVIFN